MAKIIVEAADLKEVEKRDGDQGSQRTIADGEIIDFSNPYTESVSKRSDKVTTLIDRYRAQDVALGIDQSKAPQGKFHFPSQGRYRFENVKSVTRKIDLDAIPEKGLPAKTIELTEVKSFDLVKI